MDGYLTISEVAEIYAVSEKTVRRWISSSQIIAYKVGGGRTIRIDSSSLGGILEPVNYRGHTARN